MRRHGLQRGLFIVIVLLVGSMIAASLGGTARAANAADTPTFTPTAPTHLVISEFRTRGPNGANDEFIELYNPTGAAVNINGWTIKRSTACGAAVATALVTLANTTLQAGQHYLLISATGPSLSGADQVFIPNLDDAGGLALFNSTQIIDAVGMCISTAYHEGTNLVPLTTDSAQAYMRGPSEATGCYDTDNNANDFSLNPDPHPLNKSSTITLCNGVLTSTPTPTSTKTRTATPTRTRTPTRTNTPIPGFVVINEFLPHPHSDWNEDGQVNVGDEFIELMNLSTIPVSIKNWRLDNGANTRAFILPDVSMLPRQILVFFRYETNIPLSDGGGTVRLVKSDGRTADIFNYPPVEAMDRSWCRLSSGTGFLTFDCLPTPGRPNVPLNPTPVASPTTPEPTPAVGCPLPDTVPAALIGPECGGTGSGIWGGSAQNPVWLMRRWKWFAFIE